MKQKKIYVLISKKGKRHPVFKGCMCQLLCKRTRHGLMPLTEIYDPCYAESVCRELNEKAGVTYPRYTKKKTL